MEPTTQPLPITPVLPARSAAEAGSPVARWRDRERALRSQHIVMSQIVDWSMSEHDHATTAPFAPSIVAADAVIDSLESVADAFAEDLVSSASAIDALVRYVDAAHGWFSALLAEIQAAVVRASTEGARALAECPPMAQVAAFFVRDHLEDLFADVIRETHKDPRLVPVCQAATTLHGDIVWLTCELTTQFP
jgi:hypothetical protein